MSKYALIEDGVVIQIQTRPEKGFVEVGDDVVCGMLFNGSEFEAPAPSVRNETRITKLQAVTYFQSIGAWADVKAIITSDPDLSDRWDAGFELSIENNDVIALGSAVEGKTGKDLQTMFNEASKL